MGKVRKTIYIYIKKDSVLIERRDSNFKNNRTYPCYKTTKESEHEAAALNREGCFFGKK